MFCVLVICHIWVIAIRKEFERFHITKLSGSLKTSQLGHPTHSEKCNCWTQFLPCVKINISFALDYQTAWSRHKTIVSVHQRAQLPKHECLLKNYHDPNKHGQDSQ